MKAKEDLQGNVEILESQVQLLKGQLGGAKAAAAEAAQKNAKKMIQNIINKCLATTFTAWKGYAAEGRQNRIKVQRFLIKIQKTCMVKCWSSWKDLHSEQKRHKNIVKKFVARMNNATVIKVIQSWGAYSKDRKRHKLVLRRFAKKMRNSRALSAFVSWLDFLEARKRLKYLANKIMNRLENGKIYGAWLAWFEHYDYHRRKEIEEEEEMRIRERKEADARFLTEQQRIEEEAKNERALRMVQKIVNRAIATTLSAWKDFTAEQKRNKVLVARFLKKMLNRVAAKCIESWMEYINARRFLRSFMKRMIGGKRLNTLRFKMKQWRMFTVEMRELELAHGTNSLHELIDSLSKKVHELEAQNALLVNNLGDAKLAKMESAKRNMKKKIRAWTMGCLQKTFEGWTLFLKQTKEERIKIRRFLSRINNAALSRCFLGWSSVIAQKKRNTFLIKKVSARIHNRCLVMVLTAWKTMIESKKRERVMLARFGKRLRNAAALRSFTSWMEWIEARQRLRYLTQKIINRITNTEAFAAFNVWYDIVAKERAEENMKAELQFMGAKEREAAEQVLMDKERRKKRAMEAIQRAIHGTLAKVFFAIKEMAERQKVERVKIARFLGKIKNKEVSSAYSTWMDFCSKRRFLRGIIRRFVFGKGLRLQSAAWRHWKETAVALKQMELEHGTVELEELVAKLKADLERVVAQNAVLINSLGEVSSCTEGFLAAYRVFNVA